MNQSAIYPEYVAHAEYNTHKAESLLKRISDRIGRALRTSRRGSEINQPVTFIEANLLDKNVGPEISRTLRV